MTPVRGMFIDTAEAAIRLVESPVMGQSWAEPSALEAYEIAGLAAHLLRAISTPLGYLDAPVPEEVAATSAAGYFRGAVADDDPVDSDVHRAVRQRAMDEAARGRPAVLTAARGALDSLTTRLSAEPDDRRIAVFGGMVMQLDDYLQTRIVELAIHSDDLVASCPALHSTGMPDEVWAMCRRVLADVAALRHGEQTMVIALSRAERVARPLAF
jgi:hypothetical protein